MFIAGIVNQAPAPSFFPGDVPALGFVELVDDCLVVQTDFRNLHKLLRLVTAYAAA